MLKTDRLGLGGSKASGKGALGGLRPTLETIMEASPSATRSPTARPASRWATTTSSSLGSCTRSDRREQAKKEAEASEHDRAVLAKLEEIAQALRERR